MIPTFSKQCLELSVATTEALLEFASKDEVRESICGIGIDNSMVCATDGYSAMRFRNCNPTDTQPADWNGRMFPLVVVKKALAVTKATKMSAVCLFWEDLAPTARMAPISQVVPQPGFKIEGAIGVNPKYLARLVKVAKACSTYGCNIVGLGGPLDPLLFAVEGRDLQADVVIMPMRV